MMYTAISSKNLNSVIFIINKFFSHLSKESLEYYLTVSELYGIQETTNYIKIVLSEFK
jgi:hypothetical protein